MYKKFYLFAVNGVSIDYFLFQCLFCGKLTRIRHFMVFLRRVRFVTFYGCKQSGNDLYWTKIVLYKTCKQ